MANFQLVNDIRANTLSVVKSIQSSTVDITNPVDGQADGTVLKHYQSATVQLTYSGNFSGSPTVLPAVITRVGNVVTASFQGLTTGAFAGNDKITVASGSIPTWAIPDDTTSIILTGKRDSAVIAVGAFISTNGSMNFRPLDGNEDWLTSEQAVLSITANNWAASWNVSAVPPP